jgi:hypothetical protein
MIGSPQTIAAIRRKLKWCDLKEWPRAADVRLGMSGCAGMSAFRSHYRWCIG